MHSTGCKKQSAEEHFRLSDADYYLATSLRQVDSGVVLTCDSTTGEFGERSPLTSDEGTGDIVALVSSYAWHGSNSIVTDAADGRGQD
jgi:hypothetical protein